MDTKSGHNLGSGAPPGADSGVRTLRLKGARCSRQREVREGTMLFPDLHSRANETSCLKIALLPLLFRNVSKEQAVCPSLGHSGVGEGCSFTTGAVETNHSEEAKTERHQRGHVRKFTLGQNAMETQWQAGTLPSGTSGTESHYL